MNFIKLISESNIEINNLYLNRYIRYITLCNDKNKSYAGFIERHHILPKSLFPEYIKTELNLVNLTPYQHLMAHRILYKLFYTSTEMQAALWFMYNTRNQKYTQKEYNKIKEKFAETSSINMSNTMKGKSTYIDAHGKTYWIETNSNLIKELNLKHISFGKSIYVDDKGNIYYLNTNDDKIKELNLKNINCGNKHTDETKKLLSNRVVVKNIETGETSKVDINDEEYLNGKLVSIHKDMTIIIESDGTRRKISLEEFYNNDNNYTHLNKGKVNVIDLNGNTFRAELTDERFNTGEIKVYISDTLKEKCSENITKWNKSLKGNVVWMHSKELKKQQFVKKSEIEMYQSLGWIIGKLTSRGKFYDAKGNSTINNGEVEKSVRPELLEQYLNDGWIKGRIKRAWITKNSTDKQIYLKDIESYLNDGWRKGRKKGA